MGLVGVKELIERKNLLNNHCNIFAWNDVWVVGMEKERSAVVGIVAFHHQVLLVILCNVVL